MHRNTVRCKQSLSVHSSRTASFSRELFYLAELLLRDSCQASVGNYEIRSKADEGGGPWTVRMGNSVAVHYKGSVDQLQVVSDCTLDLWLVCESWWYYYVYDFICGVLRWKEWLMTNHVCLRNVWLMQYVSVYFVRLGASFHLLAQFQANKNYLTLSS